MQSGNYLSALGIWNQVISSEPNYPVALMNRGYCNLMLGEYDAASEDYLKADSLSQNLDAKAGAQWAYFGAEKYAESLQWGRAALSIDPQNFWVKMRLAAAYKENGDSSSAREIYTGLIDEHGARAVTAAPAGMLMPYYQNTNFTGSRLKSSGYDSGAFATWNFQSGMSLGAGYAQSNLGNPTSTSGYETREIKAMAGFLFSDLSHLNLTGHYLSSNYSLLDNAVTISATYKTSIYSNFSFGADALIFPSHKGLQFNPQYQMPLARGLTLGLGANLQAINYTQTTSFYGAASASLRYCFSIFCASAGALYGSLFTPLAENGLILTYVLDELELSTFGRLAIKLFAGLEISAAYTYGRWKAINGDTPVSGTFTFAATGSLF